MIKFKHILLESLVKWVIPDITTLKREYHVEHELKGKSLFNSEEEFLEAVTNAEIKTITPAIDNTIGNRSGTKSKEDLLSLIKTYRSYPEFRNEKTLDHLYKQMQSGGKMDMPIVINKNGRLSIFSGNTRMDVAFQLGINPKVLIITV